MMWPAFSPLGVLAWIFASWIIGVLGRNRRFGFFGNFLVSFIFTPVVGVLVLLASDDRFPKAVRLKK